MPPRAPVPPEVQKAKTNARQHRYRQRLLRESGIDQVCVKVPLDQGDLIKDIAAHLRDEPESSPIDLARWLIAQAGYEMPVFEFED